MISLEELLTKNKGEITRLQSNANAFSFYFRMYLNRDPKICCTFSDYYVFQNFFKTDRKMQVNTKYKVHYKPSDILFFVKNGAVKRSYARTASLEFIEDFLKLHNKDKFPDADRMITLLKPLMDEVVVEKIKVVNWSVKEAKELIKIANETELLDFVEDDRKSVKKAVEKRIKELENE